MKKIYQYSKERFPFYQFIPLSLLFVLVIGVFVQTNLSVDIVYYRYLLAFLALFLFLFRLRLFDEFKDYEHDLKYYTNRPVARGFIKLSELLPLILFILTFELAISFFNLYNSLILFFIAFIYSLIMFKEFFCSNWLRKHFTIYIASHEILVIPLFFYIYSLFVINFDSLNSLFWMMTLFLGGQLFLLEITRKFRSKDKEIESKDTYTAQYGIKGASVIVLVLSILIILSYLYLVNISFASIFIISFLAIILFLLFNYKVFTFVKFKSSEHAKNVFNYAIFFTLGMDVIVIIKYFLM